MTSKYIFYLISLLLVIGLIVGAFFFGKSSVKPVTRIINNEYRTTIPVETRIIREKVPAIIDTVFLDSMQYEVASYSAVIDTNKVVVSLDIKYDEYSNLFDIKHNVHATRDSIYVERIVESVTKEKAPFIRIIGGLGFGTKSVSNNVSLDYADISGGIMFANKYSVAPFVALQEKQKPIYGLRLGVSF